MKYLRQIYYEMRHQRMMTWVSISGTALAIFLVMSFFMTDQLAVVEAAPETQRSRMLYGGGIEYQSENMSASSTMNYPVIMRVYGGLKGIEMMSVTGSWESKANASVKGKVAKSVTTQKTDADFWKLYDFNFIDGKPYVSTDIESDAKKIVLTRSVARNFFDTDKAAGETILINTVPYLVVGVVDDVNPAFEATFANVYQPLTSKEIFSSYDEDRLTGDCMVHLLMKPGVEEESIKKQVEARYSMLNQELKKKGIEVIYHGAPHNAEYLHDGEIFYNMTPDHSGEKKKRYAVYFVLLLIPAINLSAMMRGRLRHRVSEIGVRRAFGAGRSSIVWQLLGENLIITLVGGVIGVIISMLFMLFLASYFLEIGSTSTTALQFASSAPTVTMLFTWKSFFVAIGVCFVLNLMSAFIPAWKASRVQPAEAISKSR